MPFKVDDLPPNTTLFGQKDKCPKCSEPLDAATGRDGASPKEDDVSICFYCLSFLMYDKKLRLQLLPDEVMATLPKHVSKALHYNRKIIKEFKDQRENI